jgi:hypothetical protein
VAQLSADDDLLSSWMAHDIAGRMEAAEKAPAEDKIAAQNACAEAILRLWSHRSVIPRQLRPLVELEPVMRTLASLDVEQSRYRYHPDALSEAESVNADDETKQVLEIAIGIDYTARLLIQYALRTAAERAATSAEPWVKLAQDAGADDGPDIAVLRVVLHGKDERESMPSQEETRLKERLDRLEAFVALASNWVDDLREQLRRAQTARKDHEKS